MCERILPDIPKIKAHWERRSDPVPYLMVPMSNGEVIRFNAEIRHPGFQAAMRNLDNMKRAGDCCNSRPAGTKAKYRAYCSTGREEK